MIFLCYGTRGWIGEKVKTALQTKGHFVVDGQARCDDYDKIFQEISVVKPSCVFSSIGRTHGTDEKTNKKYTTIDFLELPGKFSVNVADNLVGPLNLARACKELGLKLAYMGTGCIFEYDAHQHQMPTIPEQWEQKLDCSTIKGFTEDDAPNFTKSGYSTVKGWTDIEMHKFQDTVLNWRIRMPISECDNGRDFITKIANYDRVCSIANSMTVLTQMIPIMIDMMERGVTGTYNMCNPGLITHNQILSLYRDFVDSKFVIRNFSLEEQAKILKAGRSNNYLDTSKLESYCKQHNLTLDHIYNAVTKTLYHRGVRNRAEKILLDFCHPQSTFHYST